MKIGKPASRKRLWRSPRRDGRFEKEGWRVRKDGTRFWAHVVIDAIRDDHGELIGYAKITRDITERKEAQEKLEKARARPCFSRRRWRRSGNSPAASPTTSTIC